MAVVSAGQPRPSNIESLNQLLGNHQQNNLREAFLGLYDNGHIQPGDPLETEITRLLGIREQLKNDDFKTLRRMVVEVRHAQQDAAAASAAQAPNGYRPYIILTRPVSELGAHIWNRELPSWGLVARVIKTLALFIFRWHLCDDILMPAEGQLGDHRWSRILFVSRDGNVIDYLRQGFDENYPHMIEKAWKRTTIENPQNADHVTSSVEFRNLNPQTVCEYFRQIYQVQLTNKERGNTLYDLAYSRLLQGP